MEDYKIDEHFVNIICELRGKVLQSCIDLEMTMDTYIAEHFCETNSKVYEMATLVLAPRIAWREKLAIFWVLIEKYNEAFKNEYPDFSKDVVNAIEHRNIFAHFPADITANGYKLFKENGIVQFLKFKNYKIASTNQIEYVRFPGYTNDEINGILSGINIYTNAVRLLLRTIK